MKQLWRRYADKLDALSLRERVLVMFACAAVLAFVLWTLALDPLFAENKRLSVTLAQQQKQLQDLQTARQALQAAQIDPDAATRAQRDRLAQEVAALEDQLRAVGARLVPADKMPRLLESLLDRNRRMQLVALRTVPAAPLVPRRPAQGEGESGDKAAASAAEKPATPAPGHLDIYRHGVELTIEGSYLDLLDYLAQLERLPWRMFWSKVSMDSRRYPRVALTLTVYTLSLDKALLTV